MVPLAKENVIKCYLKQIIYSRSFHFECIINIKIQQYRFSCVVYYVTNGNSCPLPNNKILGWSKLKEFADICRRQIKVLKMMAFVCDRVETFWEKEKNAGCQHFLVFPQCFQRAFYSGSLRVGIVELVHEHRI